MPKYNLYTTDPANNSTNSAYSANSAKLIDKMIDDYSRINKYEHYTNDNNSDNIDDQNNIIDDDIPEMEDIREYTLNSIPTETPDTENIFKNFSPFDNMFIKPIVKLIKPIYETLGYRSTEVATISLFAYFLTIYFSFYKKNNILWISFMFASLSQYIDKLYYYKLTGYYAIKEQSYVLIKFMFFLFGFILFRCNNFNPTISTDEKIMPSLTDTKSFADSDLFTLSSIQPKTVSKDKPNYNLYILLFGLIISIILGHHISKNVDEFEKKITKSKPLTNRKKAKLNTIKTDLKYMRIITYLILIFIIYNISKKTVSNVKSTKDKLNIFILNE